MSQLIHGGDIVTASAQYGVPVDDWIDLSTGINPCSYPLPSLGEHCFQQLPYQSDAFKAAVTAYYGATDFLACNGSQQVIECLPGFLPAHPVLLPDFGYQEHRDSWQKKSADCCFYPADDYDQSVSVIEQRLAEGKPFHLVVINPNNPTGLSFSAEKLKDWAEQMPEGGYLIIDEAFIDLKPEQSLLSDYDAFTRFNNMWVLRSFGKFFGLAGVRLGFLFGPSDLLKTISEHLGPWAVNGPAQAIAVSALNDRVWQQTARMRIQQNSDAMLELFKPLFHKILSRAEDLTETDMSKVGHAGLFNSGWIESSLAIQLYNFFAQRGVLVRVIGGGDLAPQRTGYRLLRLGIVDKNDAALTEKLQQVISEYILTLD